MSPSRLGSFLLAALVADLRRRSRDQVLEKRQRVGLAAAHERGGPLRQPVRRIVVLRLGERSEIDDLVPRIEERIAFGRRGHVEDGPRLGRQRDHGGAVDREIVGRRVEVRGGDGIAEDVVGPGKPRSRVHRDVTGDQPHLAPLARTQHEAMPSQLHRHAIAVAGPVADGEEVHRRYRRVIVRNVQHKRPDTAKYIGPAGPHASTFETPSLPQWRRRRDRSGSMSSDCRRQ